MSNFSFKFSSCARDIRCAHDSGAFFLSNNPIGNAINPITNTNTDTGSKKNSPASAAAPVVCVVVYTHRSVPLIINTIPILTISLLKLIQPH